MVQPILDQDAGRMPLSEAETVPFSPSLISTAAWYDVANAASVNHTSNAVNTLGDLSGNARHVSNTSTARPTYDAANGKIVFDGTNDILFNTAPFLWALPKKAVYMVATITAGANKRILGELNTGNSCRYFLQTGNSGAEQSDICPRVTTDGNSTSIQNRRLQATGFTGAKRIIRWIDEGGIFSAKVDGANALSSPSVKKSSLTLTPNRFGIGGTANTTPSDWTAMDFYELIICDNDDHGEQIEGYLAHKHGLTANLPAGHRYKTNPPMQGDITSNAPPSFSGQTIKAMLFGDSISAQSAGVSGGTLMMYANCGVFTCYNQLAGNRAYLALRPSSHNQGSSGNQLSQMVSRLGDLDALDFDVCFFMGGTNDAPATTESNFRIAYDNIISYITLKLGKTVVCQTMTPKTWSPGNEVAGNAWMDTQNLYIMSNHGSRFGRVICTDVNAAINDGADLPIANALTDNVHLQPYGALKCAQKMDADLFPYWGRNMVNFTSGNLLANGTLAGTGGTGTGQVATNWDFTYAGPLPTASKGAGGEQIVECNFTSTGADNSNVWEFKQSITSGYAQGDGLYAVALIEADNVANVSKLQIEMDFLPGGTETIHQARGNYGANGQIAENYGDFGEYCISTPTMFINNATLPTSIRVRVYLENRTTGLPTTSTVKIKGIGLFKR